MTEENYEKYRCFEQIFEETQKQEEKKLKIFEKIFKRFSQNDENLEILNKQKLFRMILKNYKKKLFVENLQPADLDKFEKQKQDDKEFGRFMTTPAKNLPEKYKYLLGEYFPTYKDRTLTDLVEASLKYLNKEDVFFSETDGKITGFVALVKDDDDENGIKNLKICSLIEGNNNHEIAKDLIELVNKLIQTHSFVQWTADLDNKATKSYRIFVKKHNGTETPDTNNRTVFKIENPNFKK